MPRVVDLPSDIDDYGQMLRWNRARYNRWHVANVYIARNVNDMRENEKKLAERTLLKLFNMEKF